MTAWSFDQDQLASIERFVAQDKVQGGLGAYLDASTTGSGKTSMAVETAHQIGANTVLLIAPVNTIDAWLEDFELRTTLPTYVIDSTDKGKANHAKLKSGERGVYAVGREFFALSATSVAPKTKFPRTLVQPEGLSHVMVAGEIIPHKPQTGELKFPAAFLELLEPDTTYPVYSFYGDEMVESEITTYQTKGRERLWTWSSCNRHLDMVIVDEGHSMSNFKATGYKVLKQLSPRKLKAYLSATPFRSDFKRAWAPTRWLWPDLIDRSQARWGAEWAEYGFNAHKGQGGGYEITGEKNPGAFVQSLPCYVRLEYEKKPVELHKIRCAMTPEQEKQYNAMLESAIAWLDDNPLVAQLPIVKLTRLRQMALAEVSFDANGDVSFSDDAPSDKIDKMVKIAQKHPDKPILYLTDSKRFAAVAAKRLSAQGQTAHAWTGDVSKSKRRTLKKGFIDGKHHIVAVAAAVAEGTNMMQFASNVYVYCNLPIDSVIKEQADGRLNRRGQPEDKVIEYQLIVPGTVDQDDVLRNITKLRGREKVLSGG